MMSRSCRRLRGPRRGGVAHDADDADAVVVLADDRQVVAGQHQLQDIGVMRRVVRLTRGPPMRVSICAKCLLTAGVVIPSSRAAALKLPQAASVEKNSRSTGCTTVPMGAGCRLGKIHIEQGFRVRNRQTLLVRHRLHRWAP